MSRNVQTARFIGNALAMPPPRIASSHDVAKLAGVSRSAVSRAYTPGAYVSAATREKVRAAAQMLGYSPNAIARSLSQRRSGLIGLVAADLHHPFLAQLTQQLALNIQARGYGVLFLVAGPEGQDPLVPKMLSYQVDGVVISVSTLDSQLASALQQAERPVVLAHEIVETPGLSAVTGDSQAGGAAAAELLYDAGRRRIAYVAGRPDTSTSRERGWGLRSELAARGLAVYAEEPGFYTYEGGADAARKLLSLSPPPDALFCASDLMAMGALATARYEFGVAVPEQVAIVGYDNIQPAGWLPQGLTTLDPNITEIARVTVDVLVEKILTGVRVVERRLIAPSLVRRSTTPT